jgi:hypothetical protein
MMYGCGTCVKVIVNLGKNLWMNCTIEPFTERPIFIKVATMPWVGTIVHSGPFRQASPGIKSALPTIGKSIVRYLHAHTDTYVRSVEAPIHSQAGLVKQPVLKNNFSKVPNLPSPVISNVLNTELIEYDSVLRKHLVSGFQYGFRLGTLGEAPSLIWKNHKSATGNPVKVFEKLAKASLKKRIAGPFKNPPLENFTGSCTYI